MVEQKVKLERILARHLKVGDKIGNSYLGQVRILGEVVSVSKEMKNNGGVYVGRRKDKSQWVIAEVKAEDGVVSKQEWVGLAEVQVQERVGK